MMSFHEKLRGLIKRAGWNQKELAAEVGVHESSISNYLKTTRPKLDETSVRLARALRVSLDYLADDTLDEMPAPEPAGISEGESRVLWVIKLLGLSTDEAARRLYVDFKQAEAPDGAQTNGARSAR